jgi:hypothetical protein
MIRSRSRLLVAVAGLSCVGLALDDQVEPVAEAAIATNAIATNAIATNAIATNAIATNAIATNALASHIVGGVAGSILNPKVTVALDDPDAQMFMQYLIGCALSPSQTLTWTSPTSGLTITWTGLLGLCPQWLGSPPSQSCKERVSACILARNNAWQPTVSVPLSMRGDQDGVNPMPLSPTVDAWPKKWRTNTTVPSSKPCSFTQAGLKRNCGWDSAGVGRCTPGSPVTISAGCAFGTSSGDPMLRVCRSLNYCDAGSPQFVNANDDSCGLKPSVTFTCPAEGYFAVLKASFSTAYGPVSATAGMGGGRPPFPATEPQVFIWREGAFYGDIFRPGAINPAKRQIRVQQNTGKVQEQIEPGPYSDDDSLWRDGKIASLDFKGVVYTAMWACSSANWSMPPAYFQRRLCAGPTGADCAAAYVGSCDANCMFSDRPPVLGDWDYGACSDSTGFGPWNSPITTFLNQPCDLVAAGFSPDLCRTVGDNPNPPAPQ